MIMKELSKESIISFLNKFSDRVVSAPNGYLIHMLGAKCIDCSIEEHWIDFEVVMPEEGVNPIRSMHGGYLAAIADHIMCSSALAFINDTGVTVTTIDLQLNPIKALYPGDKVILRCTAQHLGKRTSLMSCRFYRDGELCAIASENLTKLPLGTVSFIDYDSLGSTK